MGTDAQEPPAGREREEGQQKTQQDRGDRHQEGVKLGKWRKRDLPEKMVQTSHLCVFLSP